MKKLLVLFFLLICVNSFAKSNLVGVWIDDGKTLSVNIIDNPSEGPFTAGELWSVMNGNSKDKNIKTANMNMKCSALTRPEGDVFGSCSIKVKAEKLEVLGKSRLFALEDAEGEIALKGFKKIQNNFVVSYNNDDFIFQVNWLKGNVAFLIYEPLIQK